MKLDVWMERADTPIGMLERRPDKSMAFTYANDAPDAAQLSLALPVQDKAYGDAACVAYFGNLLFEGRELDRIMAVQGVDRDDVAGLLYHLGSDCPGAVSITPEGAGPGKRPGVFPDDYEEIDRLRLSDIVRSLHFHGRSPDGERDPSPVAGVQPKLAVLFENESYYLPRLGSRAPTTHILKVSPRDNMALTRHEASLLSLARSMKLDVAQAKHVVFHDQKSGTDIDAILSSRFDRNFDAGTVRRIHSEDLCQALGLARHLKYERDGRNDAFRFSAHAVSMVAAKTAVPGNFILEFLRHTLFNLAVGNTDNHAKNAAVLYDNATGRLAPLYDVVPVTMEAMPTHEFAFKLGNAAFAEDISEADLETAMRDLGFKRPKFSGTWLKLIKDIAGKGVSQLEAEGDKALADGVAAQLRTLESALGIDLGILRRDYFPRNVRDEKSEIAHGGWTVLS